MERRFCCNLFNCALTDLKKRSKQLKKKKLKRKILRFRQFTSFRDQLIDEVQVSLNDFERNLVLHLLRNHLHQ
jgi:hypothetical protein